MLTHDERIVALDAVASAFQQLNTGCWATTYHDPGTYAYTVIDLDDSLTGRRLRLQYGGYQQQGRIVARASGWPKYIHAGQEKQADPKYHLPYDERKNVPNLEATVDATRSPDQAAKHFTRRVWQPYVDLWDRLVPVANKYNERDHELMRDRGWLRREGVTVNEVRYQAGVYYVDTPGGRFEQQPNSGTWRATDFRVTKEQLAALYNAVPEQTTV